MQHSQGPITGFLKKVLFRSAIKHPRLQRLWSRLHTLSVFAMNYGGGAFIETSGEVWVLSQLVRPACGEAAVVFDVGANVGDYSLLVHSLIPSARIYAFEPAAPVYEQLTRRLSSVGKGAFETFNFGFSDEENTVDLYSYTVEGEAASVISSIDKRLPTQVLQVEVNDTERINVRTIDAFCASHGINHIDFLKLDVEGHELAVLRGAKGMLERAAISMIQFEFGPANIYSRTYFYDFWSMLSGKYDLFRIIPGGLAPITYYGEHLEIFLTTNYFARRKC